MTRVLAIGDVHGCLTALQTLASFVPFHETDLVVGLGDYIDRGPDTCGVLDWLIARQARGGLIALRGNHEVMMLQSRCDDSLRLGWEGCGGRAALASYQRPGQAAVLDAVPDTHWEFLEGTHRYFETETHIFVHAGLDPDLDLVEQPDEMVFWEKFHNPQPHQSGKMMVCGHTPQASLLPRDLGFAVCIDTWAYRDGWLTCLDPQSGQIWQANQAGQTRHF